MKDGKMLASKMGSIFLEEEENSYDEKNRTQLNEYYDRKLKWMTKHSALKPIPEPVPVDEHIYCAICEVRFENYL